MLVGADGDLEGVLAELGGKLVRLFSEADEFENFSSVH